MEAFLKSRAIARKLPHPIFGRRCLDHSLIKILIGEHDIRNDIGIPLRFAVLFDPCLGKDMMDIPARRLAQPGVVELDEAVGLQIPRTLRREQAKDGFGEGVVDGEGLRPESVGADLEIFPFVGWTLALGDGLHLLQIGDHFDSDARRVAVAESRAIKIFGEVAGLVVIGRLELVAVEEVAEGDEQNRIRKDAGDGDAQMGLHVVR